MVFFFLLLQLCTHERGVGFGTTRPQRPFSLQAHHPSDIKFTQHIVVNVMLLHEHTAAVMYDTCVCLFSPHGYASIRQPKPEL